MTEKFNRDELKRILSNNAHRVRFTKKDGSIRFMLCTLDSSLIPEKFEEAEPATPRKVSETTLRVYDLEAEGWRSFIIANVIEVFETSIGWKWSKIEEGRWGLVPPQGTIFEAQFLEKMDF